jgi:hypothetical protein
MLSLFLLYFSCCQCILLVASTSFLSFI